MGRGKRESANCPDPAPGIPRSGASMPFKQALVAVKVKKWERVNKSLLFHPEPGEKQTSGAVGFHQLEIP